MRRRGDRPSTPRRPDTDGLEPAAIPVLQPPARTTGRTIAFALVYAALGIVWLFAVPAAAPGWEHPPSDASRAMAALIAVVALVGGSLLARRSFAGPPSVAARQAARTALVVGVASLVPLLGAFAAVFVPYLIGLALRADRYGRVRLRIIYVAIVAIVATTADAFWVVASQGL